MAHSVPADPVKYLIAALYRRDAFPDPVERALRERWGAIDLRGEEHPFDLTDYYREEMGEGLVRRILSFERLLPPTELVAMKLACNDIEDATASDGKRSVNLDCGYLDHHKVVLASCKGAGHKLYLDRGIWGDMTCRWQKGAYRPFEWSFPDFKEERYRKELAAIRERYLFQIRQGKTI